jgi:hypothetical protein
MNRRARLPGADELFRATGGQPPAPTASADDRAANGRAGSRRADAHRLESRSSFDDRGFDEDHDAVRSAASFAASEPSSRTDERSSARGGARARRGAAADARPTGRERHDEKITVYCSPEELLQIERARLDLRGSHGLAVDRGRIVREAIAVVLADLEAKGDASILVRRLRGR